MYITQNFNNNIYSTQKPNSKPHNPQFCGITYQAASEIGLGKVEYSFRVIGNKITDLFTGRFKKTIIKTISMIIPKSDEKYLAQLDDISRFYSAEKKIHINIEDKILEEIAKSGKSVIFIMNHSNQKQDPSMLAVLNTLLTKAYKDAGKPDGFPLPKIILNQDILTSMNPTRRKAFEAFGAVGIDANLFCADKSVNAKAFLPLVKSFVKNECNIFIFPEGKMAINTSLNLHERFQQGVAELVNKTLGIKKEVIVVPVGFSYGNGADKAFNAIHIGKPVTFKRTKNGETTTTSGSILSSEFANKLLRHFFKKHADKQDVIMTHCGEPIKPEDLTKFIRRLLSENLEVCTKEAEKKFDTERANICILT